MIFSCNTCKYFILSESYCVKKKKTIQYQFPCLYWKNVEDDVDYLDSFETSGMRCQL